VMWWGVGLLVISGPGGGELVWIGLISDNILRRSVADNDDVAAAAAVVLDVVAAAAAARH